MWRALTLLLIAGPPYAMSFKTLPPQKFLLWMRSGSSRTRSIHPKLAANSAAPPDGFEWGYDSSTDIISNIIDKASSVTPKIDGVIDFEVSEERSAVSERRRRLLKRRRLAGADDASKARLRTRCIAEAMGTAFIFLCGSLVASAGWSNAVIALAWGSAVGLAVLLGAGLTGAHYNPAVTVALMCGNAFPMIEAPAYLFSQYVGAVLASKALPRLARATLVSPALPALGLPCGIGGEIALTGVLLYSCLAIGDGVESGRVTKRAAPALVGLLIATINIAFANVGAGINPAMNAGPRLAAALSGSGMAALRGGTSYTLGPLLGGVLGGCMFAVSSGRGQGLYAALARVGRVFSPWYGEHWEVMPSQQKHGAQQRGVVVPTAPGKERMPTTERGVVVPSARVAEVGAPRPAPAAP